VTYLIASSQSELNSYPGMFSLNNERNPFP
jgi:hypothetical protein